MKRRLLLTICGLVLLACALPARPANAAVDVGVSINTGGRHGGISLNFRSRPDVVLIPSSRVYYVRNYDRDLYRYDDNWYYVQDDCWYRASSYRGPFIEISYSSVPYYVRSVPVRYRRHWGNAGSASYGHRDDRSGRYVNRDNTSRDREAPTWNREDSNQDRRDRNQNRGNRDGSRNRGSRGR